MRFLTILVIAVMVFGICGILGGLVMLWAGYLLSRIDAFHVTPLQAAAICVGVTIIFAIALNQLLAASLFRPFRMKEEKDEEDYDEEEEDKFPVRRVVRPKKRR